MAWTRAFAAWLLMCAPAAAQAPVDATTATRAANEAALAALPQDSEDEDFAQRGFIATRADPIIRNQAGGVVMDLSAYDFLQGPAPATVNPSLWRHQRLLARHGLFQVSERIYQVRGFDVSNMTIVVGDTGYIVLDPLLTAETARAAMALVREHLGDRPVVAVVYSHSHGDHFGGVRGVVDQADVTAGRVRIIAPHGFIEEAVSENVIAGNAMSRRATYQFGVAIPPGPEGAMGVGIGPALSRGSITLIPPTETIDQPIQDVTIDGVRFQFQLTPGTEAPAEMNAYLPDLRALWLAENANATMHNVLTPRGALVRDTRVWAHYLSQALSLYGPNAEIMFTSHAWPRWGNERIRDFIASHRDAYKYLHDQSVRLMNQGFTGEEIAERVRLPESLAQRWFNRGYYGTMMHNSRAVYQRYMGWYDGNPANLYPLSEPEAAPRYVAAMGGARRVLRMAQQAFDRGEYRWAAELLNHLVFADSENTQARALLARTHTQMAFQAESAIWRGMYLSAAAELGGRAPFAGATTQSLDLIAATPSAMILDLLAVRLNPQTAAPMRFNLVFPDRNERFAVSIENSVLVYEADRAHADAQATITAPRAAFLAAMFAPQFPAPPPRVEGDGEVWTRFRASFDAPDPAFPIVTP
ncbi:MAG: alkyl/aryl-sulfatase [Hyphomonadaceae bacterium]